MNKLITILVFTLLSTTSVFAGSVGTEMLAADCDGGRHPAGSRHYTGKEKVIPSVESLLAQAQIQANQEDTVKGNGEADR